jgi:hypothetical protein
LHRWHERADIRISPDRSPEMTDKPVDIAAYARAMAAALDLPLTGEYAPQVEANLAVAFRLAPLFLDFPLPDDAEPAPVFRANGETP